MSLERRVRSCLEPLPEIDTVRLVGSRASGQTVPLSDWDFALQTLDFAALAAALPAAVAPLEPLGTLWDPLSRRANFMLVLPGPHKVDLLFDRPQEQAPPWTPTPASLPEIDVHFWDWVLWLAAKSQRGSSDVVRTELAKMTSYLLAPIGVRQQPGNISQAVDLYLIARQRLASECEVTVPTTLGNVVHDALRRHGIVASSHPSDQP